MRDSIDLGGRTDSQVQFAPFSFIRSGLYYHDSGGTGTSTSSNGLYWQSWVMKQDTAKTSNLYYYSHGVIVKDYSDRGRGFALRCLVR